MKKRIQINTRISERTQRQIAELREQCGYSLRDVVTLSVDKLHTEKIQEVNRMTPRPDDIREMFDPYAVADGMSPELVAQQIGEMRASEPDSLDLTDKQIADILQSR